MNVTVLAARTVLAVVVLTIGAAAARATSIPIVVGLMAAALVTALVLVAE